MLSLLFDQMFFSAVLYAFFCCTAQFHYPFHFYFQRKLPSLKRIGVNYTCATNAVLPCNIQCGFKHKISSKTAKFKKEKKKNKLAQMLTVSHQLSSLTFISLSALSHSLSLFFCHFLDCRPHKHPYHKLLWSCQPCSLLSIQPPFFTLSSSVSNVATVLERRTMIWFLWPSQVLFLTKSPFATLIIVVSAEASDCGAHDVMHVQRVIVIFDCLL